MTEARAEFERTPARAGSPQNARRGPIDTSTRPPRLFGSISPLPFRLAPPQLSPASPGAAALDCGTVRPRLGRAPSEINPGPCGRPLGWSGGLLGGRLGLGCLGVLRGAALFPSCVLASAAQAFAAAGTGVLRGRHRRAVLVHSGRAVAPKRRLPARSVSARRFTGVSPEHAADPVDQRRGWVPGLANARARSRGVAARGAKRPAGSQP